MGVWLVNSTPRPIYPRERRDTHFIGGWVVPMIRLGGCGKSHPPPGFDLRKVQPVASRHINYTMPAHVIQWNLFIYLFSLSFPILFHYIVWMDTCWSTFHVLTQVAALSLVFRNVAREEENCKWTRCLSRDMKSKTRWKNNTQPKDRNRGHRYYWK